MSFRTLKFGDRTISYDTGLNADEPSSSERLFSLKPLSTSEQHLPDDGIGTSDDETGSNSSKSGGEDSNRPGNPGDKSGADSDMEVPNKKMIKLDLGHLLAFDEDEEYNYEDESDCSNGSDSDDAIPGRTTDANRSGWHKTVAKDLVANLTRKKAAKKPLNKAVSDGTEDDASRLVRRHSITLCQSRNRKVSPAADPTSTHGHPFMSMSESPFSVSPDLITDAEPFKTLNLRLDEVSHIRSVLTKAQLESSSLDGDVRLNVERGKVCFSCTTTRFGLFSRGQRCEMCKQVVCHKCHSKMRIPVEHFSATPVFALSPSVANVAPQPLSPKQPFHSISNFSQLGVASFPSGDFGSPMSLGPSYLAAGGKQPREKKLSLPAGLNAFSLQSVGSAPSSPSNERRALKSAAEAVKTISSSLARADPWSNAADAVGEVTKSKYATLPRKARRLSWLSPKRDEQQEREWLEGSLLTVCADCKDMVVQVIRVSRTNKRLRSTNNKSMLLSLTPDVARELRGFS